MCTTAAKRIENGWFLIKTRDPVPWMRWDFEKWSLAHQARAEELIVDANSVDKLKQILRDRVSKESKTAICTVKEEDECFTHSAFIFDTQSCKAYYCQGNPLENEFKEYAFN